MKTFSIRSRLIFWIGSVVTLILSIGSYVVYQTARSTLYQEIDQNLASVLELSALELEIIDGVIVHEWLTDILNDAARSDSAYFQVWDETTHTTNRSPALGDSDLPRHLTAGKIIFTSFLLPNGHHGRSIGRRVYPVVEWTDPVLESSMQVESPPYYMAIAIDVEASEFALKRLVGTLLLGLVFSLMVSIVTIRLIIALSFRPLDRLEKVIDQTDVNNPKDIFEVPHDLPSEVTSLVTQYRELFSKISRIRDREREFSANVAHELRTPLAGIEATLEQALVLERDAGDYKERIAETLQIANKMGGLINRLMWFSRLYNRSAVVDLGEVDLFAILEIRLVILNTQITERGLVIDKNFAIDVAVLDSDEAMVEILMNNLIGNAVAHSELSSTINIEVCRYQGCAKVTISNVCRSLDRSELSKIFQPFYRSDLARSGDLEHSGIGLALVQEIANLLQVELKVSLSDAHIFTIEVLFSEK